jgi:hypothetical protein
MAIIFVTWKLDGAAPKSEPDLITKDNEPIRAQGPRWLADPRIAKIVADALQFGARSERYELLAWSIMPNHMHILILPKQSLSRIMGVAEEGDRISREPDSRQGGQTLLDA